jgi:peptide/nickel transport system permease protein
MRAADVFLSFPVILGAIAVIAVVGPGLRNIFLAIALFGWPVFARLFRSTVLSNRERDYVRAATVMGASDTSVFFRHILPNSVGPLISYTALAVAAAILAEAGLSFINLGVQRPHPSWGLMLAESRGFFEQAIWLALAPGIALTLTTLAFILIGSAANRTIDGGASRGGV